MTLAEPGAVVAPVNGATHLGRFAQALAAVGGTTRLAGLYGGSEETLALRALQRAGVLAEATRAAAARAGFFACDRDLEDELIRAAGIGAVERLLAQADELASFRRFQRQPGHRDRATHAQLKRFMGTRAGRKARLGHLLASLPAPDRLPPPLRSLLARAASATRAGLRRLSAASRRTPAPRASRSDSPRPAA